MLENYPHLPMILNRKSYSRTNVLIGSDAVQVRFAEQLLNLSCEDKKTLVDEDVLDGIPSHLFRVQTENDLALSTDVLKKVGVWAIPSLVPGSPGMGAILKYAGQFSGVTLKKYDLERVSSLLTTDYREDIRCLIWDSVWEMLDPKLGKKYESWAQPWEKLNWIPEGVEPSQRLNSLYKDMVGYVYAGQNDLSAARDLGLSQKRFAYLGKLALDLTKVEMTIRVLSSWRRTQDKSSVFTTALKISKIWR